MRRLLQGSLFALLLCLGITSALADAQTDFRNGQQAFRKGDYRRALDGFEKARQAGMRDAAIFYNLGVTHYKLGHYDQAEAAFLQAARFKQIAALAWYNLGLVKRKQGDSKDAAHWFRKARDNTDDPRLRALAARQLAATRSRWRSFAYAGLGYDDNITLTSDVITVPTGSSDGFLELYAQTRGILSGRLRDGVLLRAGAFGDFYASLGDYNYTDLFAGIYKSLPLGKWTTEGGLRLSRSSYGGNGYLQIVGLELRGRRSLSRTTRLQLRFRARSLSAIDNRYDYLSGSSYDLRLGARWRAGSSSTVRAYYQFQDNDRNDLRTSNYFHSVSPQRHRLRVDWRQRLSVHWKLRLGAEYRLSLYKQDNVYYFLSNRHVRRQDNRLRAMAELTRKLSPGTDLVYSYTYTDNSSNVGPISLPSPGGGTIDYDYTRNLAMVAVQHAF